MHVTKRTNNRKLLTLTFYKHAILRSKYTTGRKTKDVYYQMTMEIHDADGEDDYINAEEMTRKQPNPADRAEEGKLRDL